MQKDMIFFSENGLTSTSANHICNLAKEYIQQKQSMLDESKFTDINISLIGSSSNTTLQEGVKSLDYVMPCIKAIIQAKSLIAWLREAIKARQNLLDEIRKMDTEDYAQLMNVEYPDYPDTPKFLTEDECMANLSIKERNRYYELDTMCAVIGKYIHPNGSFSTQRKAMEYAKTNPCRLSGEGRDAVVYKTTASLSSDEVESTFFELQKAYREHQAELNGIKFKIEKALSDDEITKKSAYNAELQQIQAKRAIVEHKLSEYKSEKAAEISSLKITIPNDLLAIYKTISNLGNDK